MGFGAASTVISSIRVRFDAHAVTAQQGLLTTQEPEAIRAVQIHLPIDTQGTPMTTPCSLTCLRSSLALLALAVSGATQSKSFYIDIGSTNTEPSGSYTAASNRSGYWNDISTAFQSTLLRDTTGALPLGGTSITRNVQPGATVVAGTSYGADDDALLSDFETVATTTTWIVAGLDPGDYAVIVYAFDPSDPSAQSDVQVIAGGTSNSSPCGGAAGTNAEPLRVGMTHVVLPATVPSSGPLAGRIDIQVDNFLSPHGCVNGIQIMPLSKSYYVDVGMQPDAPYYDYSAAASEGGFWHGLFATPVCWVMDDTLGLASGGACPLGPTYFNASSASSLTGGDAALMNDYQDIGAVGQATTWEFFLPLGSYYVNVYAWDPANPSFLTAVDVSGGGPTQVCGGGLWSGAHVLDSTYVQFLSTNTTGSLLVTLTTMSGFGSFNGIQFIPRSNSYPGFCFGDGTGTACPCGNNGAAGSGCANSSNAAGAVLAASGLASVSADTLVLTGSGMPATGSCLYFQGTTQISTSFGDGLRCAGGTVVRLGTKVNSAGSSQYPAAGDQLISIRGMVPPGATRTYQAWYRNAAAFCTPSTFNLSNGVAITWN